MYSDRLKETLPEVRGRIAAAAGRVGRDPAAVTLVAVTKTHPIEAIDAAVEAGLSDLGENRVQELLWKREARPDLPVRWHMIGHVQSRKGPQLVGVADLVHSVDSLKLAQRISRQAVEAGIEVGCLIQVNTSGEEAKSGLSDGSSVEAICELAELPGIRAEGLMTMAPFVDDERVLRECFSGLRELAGKATQGGAPLGSTLSMGMTNDLEYAIEEGSTMVRIGTALFGPRPTNETG